MGEEQESPLLFLDSRFRASMPERPGPNDLKVFTVCSGSLLSCVAVCLWFLMFSEGGLDFCLVLLCGYSFLQ